MSNPPSQSSVLSFPAGYRSAESRRAYRTAMILLLVSLGVVQFIGPFIAMIPMMPKIFAMQNQTVVKDRLSLGTWHEGQWWYPAQVVGQFGLQRSELRSLGLEEDSEPVVHYNLPDGEAWLLATDDRIRIFSGSVEGIATAADIDTTPVMPPRTVLAATAVGDSVIYLHINGKSMELVEIRETGHFALFTLPPSFLPPSGGSHQRVRMVSSGETLYIYVATGGTLQFTALDLETSAKSHTWSLIAQSVHGFAPVVIDGKPVVVVSEGAGPGGSALNGYVLQSGAWKRIFSHPRGISSEVAAFANDKRITVLSESFPGSIHMLQIDDGTISIDQRLTNDNPMAIMGPMMKWILILQIPVFLLPLVAALVGGKLMARHRDLDFVTETGRTVRLATLGRRGLAHSVDLLIVFFPYGLGMISMFSLFSDMETLMSRQGAPTQLLGIVALVFGGMLWIPVSCILLSMTEGLFGWTPGKKLFGLLVFGEDMIHCGFGRGLLRNLCRVADGMFNYLPGISMAAFTPKVQRIGDFVAKTIVIEKTSLTERITEKQQGG